jgi:hypothetical protein
MWTDRRHALLGLIVALMLLAALALALGSDRTAQAQGGIIVTVREQTVTIASLAPRSAFEVKAPCGSGEVAVGGGARVPPESGVRSYLSAPTAGAADGWQAGFANGSSPARSVTVTAYAVCTSGSAATTTTGPPTPSLTPQPTPGPTPGPTPTPTQPTTTMHKR